MGNNLDKRSVEKLLETMEPSEIRKVYGSQLGGDPQIEALLNAFENLDGNLAELKAADPPPTLQKPTSRARFTVLRGALPLAAVLLLGFLFWVQYDEIPTQTETGMATTPARESLAEEPGKPTAPLAQDLLTDEDLKEEAAEAHESDTEPPAPVFETSKSGDHRQSGRSEPAPVVSESLERRGQQPKTDAANPSEDDQIPERKTKIDQPPPSTRLALPERQQEGEVSANAPRSKKRTRSERPAAATGEDLAAKPPVGEKTSSALSAGTELFEERTAQSAPDQMDRDVSARRESYIVPTKPTPAQEEIAAKRWLDLFDQWQQGHKIPPGLFSDSAMVQWPRAVLPPEFAMNPEFKPQVRLWYQGLHEDRGILLGWEPTGNHNNAKGTLLLVLNGLGECIRLTRL